MGSTAIETDGGGSVDGDGSIRCRWRMPVPQQAGLSNRIEHEKFARLE